MSEIARADTAPSFYTREGKPFELKRLSHRHMAIMDYMLANPTVPMSIVAEEHGVTGAWLSTVRHSDLFKALLNERRKLMEQDQHFRITRRLMDVAEVGLDAMANAVADEEVDPRFKLDATKTALEAIGFLGKNVAPKTAEGQPGVTINISGFEEARQMAMQGSKARIINQEDVE